MTEQTSSKALHVLADIPIYVCPKCGKSISETNDGEYRNHLFFDHRLSMHVLEKCFKSKKEFDKWKLVIQKLDDVSFSPRKPFPVKCSTNPKKYVYHYSCNHRYTDANLKNARCPAWIKLTYHVQNSTMRSYSYTASYCFAHIGHSRREWISVYDEDGDDVQSISNSNEDENNNHETCNNAAQSTESVSNGELMLDLIIDKEHHKKLVSPQKHDYESNIVRHLSHQSSGDNSLPRTTKKAFEDRLIPETKQITKRFKNG